MRLPWGSCLRGCTGSRLRGSAPSSAPGALRGRSPRFACPVRPLGRLPLGLVEIGVGLGFPSRVSSPDAGVGVYEVGRWVPSWVSLPQPGVYKAGQRLGVAASSPLAHIKPVSAIQQAPAPRISFVIISRNSAFTLRRSQFVDSLHMDISPNCTTRLGLGSTHRI